MQIVSASPLTSIDLHSAASIRAVPSATPGSVVSTQRASDPADSLPGHEAEALVGNAETLPSIGRLFDFRELELSISDDEYRKYANSRVCGYPDSLLRVLGGGEDDCGVIKPEEVWSDIFTLPFLALSGWVGVVVAVAGLHWYFGTRRVRRWLRRNGLQVGNRGAVSRRGFRDPRPWRPSAHSKSRRRLRVG